MSQYRLKLTKRDGKPHTKFQCPGCSIWGSIDDDQYHGKVSIQCQECDFHETINLGALVLAGDAVVINNS